MVLGVEGGNNQLILPNKKNIINKQKKGKPTEERWDWETLGSRSRINRHSRQPIVLVVFEAGARLLALR